ncbi:hypothetical protein C5S53_06910 [Methanophagales archaeon]|nr:hypothetical protein C5S53_06910 [Methanophagales archaeon]
MNFRVYKIYIRVNVNFVPAIFTALYKYLQVIYLYIDGESQEQELLNLVAIL